MPETMMSAVRDERVRAFWQAEASVTSPWVIFNWVVRVDLGMPRSRRREVNLDKVRMTVSGEGRF